jgi:hypothetical protein
MVYFKFEGGEVVELVRWLWGNDEVDEKYIGCAEFK